MGLVAQQAQGATLAPLRRDAVERKQALTRSRAESAASRPTLRSGASILETGSTASLVPLSSFRDPPPRRLFGKGGSQFCLCVSHSGCFALCARGNRRVFPTLGIGEASGLLGESGLETSCCLSASGGCCRGHLLWLLSCWLFAD